MKELMVYESINREKNKIFLKFGAEDELSNLGMLGEEAWTVLGEGG